MRTASHSRLALNTFLTTPRLAVVASRGTPGSSPWRYFVPSRRISPDGLDDWYSSARAEVGVVAAAGSRPVAGAAGGARGDGASRQFRLPQIVGEGDTTEVGLQTGTVSRRTIESTVSTSGTVAATRQVRITPSAAGQIQEVLVKQGDRLEEGQPLATLNAFNLEVKHDQAHSTLRTAQYRLEALLVGPTNSSDVATAQQSVATAQSSLTRAQNDLFNLLAGPNADDVAAARASVERSSASLQAAQSNYDKLVNRTDLTLGPEYASLQAARSSYQTALSNYVNRTAPPNPLDVSNAQASVTSAQASLDSARTRLVEVLRGPDPLDVAIAQNQVTS